MAFNATFNSISVTSRQQLQKKKTTTKIVCLSWVSLCSNGFPLYVIDTYVTIHCNFMASNYSVIDRLCTSSNKLVQVTLLYIPEEISSIFLLFNFFFPRNESVLYGIHHETDYFVYKFFLRLKLSLG